MDKSEETSIIAHANDRRSDYQNNLRWAAQGEARWREMGYDTVRMWVEAVSVQHPTRPTQRKTVWCVRSNLVNGLPPEISLNKTGTHAIIAYAKVKSKNGQTVCV